MVVLGTVALARRSMVTLLTAMGLFVGTIAVALVVSLRYPSFTDRTVLYAVLGWSIVVGAAPAAAGVRSWMATMGTAVVCLVLVVSTVTLGSIYTGASKQPFRQLADDTDRVAAFGWPVVTYPQVTGIIIDAYHPHLPEGRHFSVSDNGLLPPLGSARRHLPPAFWFARVGGPGDVPAPAQKQLSALGYLRLLHHDYPAPLSLDLYVRSGVDLGRQLGVNGDFSGSGPAAPGWAFPTGGFSFLPEQGASRRLLLGNAVPGEQNVPTRFAIGVVPAVPAALYSLRFQERTVRAGGIFQAFLICQSSAGAFLSVAPGAAAPQAGKALRWNDSGAAILCPTGTTSLRIDMRVSGAGQDAIRAVRVWEVRSHSPAP